MSELSQDRPSICSQYLRVEIDDQGNLQKVTNLKKNLAVPFTSHGLYWYGSFPGNNSQSEFQASGAYIFRPISSEAESVSMQRSM